MTNLIKDQLAKQPNGKKEKSKEVLEQEKKVRAERANKANGYISSKLQKDFIEAHNCRLELDSDIMFRNMRLTPIKQDNGALIFGISVPMGGSNIVAVGLTDEEKKDILQRIEDEAKEAKEANKK